MYIDHTHMLYSPIEWYAKTAESMIDLLNGADMVCKNGGTDVIPIEWPTWYVKTTELTVAKYSECQISDGSK